MSEVFTNRPHAFCAGGRERSTILNMKRIRGFGVLSQAIRITQITCRSGSAIAVVVAPVVGPTLGGWLTYTHCGTGAS
jgi:hypothetical protein